MRWLAALLLLIAGAAAAQQPNIALYYGRDVPWDELAAFDAVVLEAEAAGPIPPQWGRGRTLPLAYLSLGEMHPSRAYFKDLPAAWRLGENTAWGSVVVDQSQPDWPKWLVERGVKPLWDAGYRGFFLDTLDSYQLAAKTGATRAEQENGLARVVAEIRRAYPEAKLIFNRGFEILPKVHHEAWVVAAESLFRGWNQAEKRYQEVLPADRDWLIGQLRRARDEYKLPVLAIDYVAPEERALARTTAKKIESLGFVPWVSNPELDLLGVGAIEVMPRKILMLYDDNKNEAGLILHEISRFATMPLNHMGYTAKYIEASRALPAHPLAGRYAAVVSWLSETAVDPSAYARFLQSAFSQGIRVAMFGGFGLAQGALLDKHTGLKSRAPGTTPARVTISIRDPMMGLELAPLPDRRQFYPLQAVGGTPLLRLANERGDTMDAAALMPWGGYVLAPHALIYLPNYKGARWVIDPFTFLTRALALPLMPAPDVTTENGRRLMLVHMDGDGFASRAELPGTPLAGEAVLSEFFAKYRIPSTASVIQGEVAADGLYPQLSPALEAAAKRLFALPHVEIASHSLSHPFRWSRLELGNESGSYSLKLPNYHFDINAEINGSIAYINSRLAPPGKQVKVFLWTGDSNPGADSVARAAEAGVGNMNGGDTWISRAEPSLTLVSPIGIPKGNFFQVFAPNQNENLYTNLWNGPFYGYERVVETFQMTDSPRRLKPVDIYFHTYSATKRASIAALHKVYQWALARDPFNVYASEYINKAFDFNTMTVAKSGEGWLIRGSGALRTVRFPAAAGHPDMERSRSLAGYARHNDQHYLHLAGGEAYVALAPEPPRAPFLEQANGRIEQMTRDAKGFSVRLSGHLPLAFSLGAADGCELRADGRPLLPKAANKNSHELPLGTATISAHCR